MYITIIKKFKFMDTNMEMNWKILLQIYLYLVQQASWCNAYLDWLVLQ